MTCKVYYKICNSSGPTITELAKESVNRIFDSRSKKKLKYDIQKALKNKWVKIIDSQEEE